MSEHDLPPLPGDLASLLDAERARPAPAPDATDRLFSRLEASIGALPPVPAGGGGGGSGGGGDGGDGGAGGGGHAGGHAAGTAAAGAGGASAAGAATKAGVAGALLAKPVALATATFALGSALGAAVDHAAVQPEPPRTKIVYVDRVVPLVPTGARTAASDEPAVTALSAAPKGTSRPPPTQSGAAGASAASAQDTPSGHDAQLAGERALIEIARTALAKGDSAAALDALGKHAAKYPRGQLAEEREALAVEALAGAGRMDEARARAARFKRDFPSSMLMPVVDSALK